MESVRKKDAFIIQSLYAISTLSINDKLCRLLFFIGAIKDASAASITLIVPYLCYAGKDQKSEPRGPVTTHYMAMLLEAIGIDYIVTIDVHDIPAYQNAFRCPTENLEAKNLFLDYLGPKMQQEDIVVMSPDIGGIKRAERFQKDLQRKLQRNVGLAFKEKYRNQGVVSGEMIVGDVKNKTVLLIDDMISTGGTIARAVTACKSAGAKGVIAAVTHGLFSGNAPEVLKDDHLKQIIITNTVPPFRLEGTAAYNKLTILDVAPLFAATIKNMYEGGSVTALL